MYKSFSKLIQKDSILTFRGFGKAKEKRRNEDVFKYVLKKIGSYSVA